MKIKNKIYFFIGVSVLLALLISYFVNINIDEGANYFTQTSLLGIIIFYNPFILGIYIFLGIFFILKGIKKI